MTSGKQKRNRFFVPTPGERATDDARRLEQVNRSIDEECKYRDACLRFADGAARRIETLKEEQLRLVEVLNARRDEVKA